MTTFWQKVAEVLLRRPAPDSERASKARDIELVKRQSDAALIRVARLLRLQNGET